MPVLVLARWLQRPWQVLLYYGAVLGEGASKGRRKGNILGILAGEGRRRIRVRRLRLDRQ